MADRATVQAIAAALGQPDHGLAVFMVPDGVPERAHGEWAACFSVLSTFGLGGSRPIAYGATAEEAEKNLFAMLTQTVTEDAAKATAEATAKEARKQAVVAAVPKDAQAGDVRAARGVKKT